MNNVIVVDNKLYEILRSFTPSYFKTKAGEVKKELLGTWVSHLEGDRVIEKDSRYLICKEIEEAKVIENE